MILNRDLNSVLCPFVSDFSSKPWRNLPPPQVGDPHGDPQTSPQHTDPHGLGALKKNMQEIHVDQRVLGWSAGRHLDHPCGGQISPWLARKVTECGALCDLFEFSSAMVWVWSGSSGSAFLFCRFLLRKRVCCCFSTDLIQR